jgi:hypothetical protein
LKSKQLSGLAKLWILAVLVTCGAAFTSSGLQTKNGRTRVLTPGKHFERVLIIVLENQDYFVSDEQSVFSETSGQGNQLY